MDRWGISKRLGLANCGRAFLLSPSVKVSCDSNLGLVGGVILAYVGCVFRGFGYVQWAMAGKRGLGPVALPLGSFLRS